MQKKRNSRLTRLTSILIQLQSQKLLTSTKLAEKFEVSIRTIYRDIKTLEQAGVPILIEEGKGYSLMEGYTIPPIMFTEDESNALITAERLVQLNKDSSLISNYTAAINKIKAVLRNNTKEKIQLLSERVAFWKHPNHTNSQSNFLSIIQIAITDLKVIRISYYSPNSDKRSEREIEPFAIINKQGEDWYLIAWCRLRKDYRLFRFDRIKNMLITNEVFRPHKIGLEEYLAQYRKNNF